WSQSPGLRSRGSRPTTRSTIRATTTTTTTDPTITQSRFKLAHLRGRPPLLVPFQLSPPREQAPVNYTYVLFSERDGQFYTGSTSDLRARLAQHRAGRVRSTASRGPLILVYYEASVDIADAQRRERFLKTGTGKRYLNKRLSTHLSLIRPNKLERH